MGKRFCVFCLRGCKSTVRKVRSLPPGRGGRRVEVPFLFIFLLSWIVAYMVIMLQVTLLITCQLLWDAVRSAHSHKRYYCRKVCASIIQLLTTFSRSTMHLCTRRTNKSSNRTSITSHQQCTCQRLIQWYTDILLHHRTQSDPSFLPLGCEFNYISAFCHTFHFFSAK